MADQSGSANFRALFEVALQAYEKKTGFSLAQHPLAVKLQSCDSVEEITALLQGKAQAFSDFHANHGGITRSIKIIVSGLSLLSNATSFANAVALVRRKVLMACLTLLSVFLQTLFPPTTAIQAGLAILLDVCAVLYLTYSCHYDIQMNQAATGVISSGHALDLLESIEQFVKRLDIYIRIPLTPAMVEMVVKILVELLSTLASVTKELKQRRSSECLLADVILFSAHVVKIAKKFFGAKDIEAVLQRLDRLTQDEVRTTAAQTLEVVYGLVHNMREFMDGEQMHWACCPLSV